MITPLPIANGFYRSDSLPVSAQQCINFFPVIEDAPSLSPETLRAIPGIVEAVNTGDGKGNSCRGAWSMNGLPYFVNGITLYRLNIDNTTTSLGAIPGSKRVSMAENGTQLMILEPGGSGYIYTESTGVLVEITDSDFTANGNPQAVVFLDGYFVCTTDAKKFINSALNDGTSYNALDFGSAESSPDAVVSPVVYKNQLFIGGETTLEGFNNVGGAGFPFQRMGLFLDQGFSSTFSVVNATNTFVFIGAGTNEFPAVWMLAGNTTEKISTKAIDHLLLGATRNELRAITAWSYSQGGHFFTGFNVGDTTIVYDFSTGRWHERQSRVPATDVYAIESWRPTAFVSAYGKVFVGDSQNGTIGYLDIDTFTEYGSEVLRSFTTQPFQNNMEPFSVPYLELTVESGTGNATDTDPQIMMDRSRDGGKNFTDERWREIGEVGEYQRRAIWRRNGRVDRFDVYRFTVSDKAKMVGIQLTAEII